MQKAPEVEMFADRAQVSLKAHVESYEKHIVMKTLKTSRSSPASRFAPHGPVEKN